MLAAISCAADCVLTDPPWHFHIFTDDCTAGQCLAVLTNIAIVWGRIPKQDSLGEVAL